ncbi:hypothetical protein RN001_010346 [Aquatica leii]|uniref:Uncharacterized protein n=1 Tax=Aquatica leii TaxID=1421715 RepID=A0AAN7P0T6_9COLE|nr:hypothetical protein RN001_010346 [Aquatica leii]
MVTTEERNVIQLKKLWTNLKQGQREALTKERQARFATGGGPAASSAVIDPNISTIVPKLMTTAPVLFTSNMPDKAITQKRNDLIKSLEDDLEENNEVVMEFEPVIFNNTSEHVGSFFVVEPARNDDGGDNNVSLITSDETPALTSLKSDALKRKKENQNFYSKKSRLEHLVQYEQELFMLKKAHEEEIHVITIAHLKKKHAFELREAEAKAQLAEIKLKNFIHTETSNV